MDELLSRSVLTVSELTQNIKEVVERSFPHLWVTGEVSNLRLPSSGHLYFTLKDELSQIRVVMFRSNHKFLKFIPQDGVQVIAGGMVSVYEKRGEYQLICDYLEPKGKGALQLAFEQLKERLKAEGLFDEAHKKPIPLLPAKIGLVTSATGAAVRDILTVINSRFAEVEILIYPVKVQGEEAPGEVVEALNYLNEATDVEVIILARGGGSIEDLWAFNEEEVARAIYHSRAPVISAVGHETDYTIADFVADLRAPTPTAAALVVVQNKLELNEKISGLARRLNLGIEQILEGAQWDLQNLRAHLISPLPRLRQISQRVDEFLERATSSLKFILKEKCGEWGRTKEHLFFAGPQRRLKELPGTLDEKRERLTHGMRVNLDKFKKMLERDSGLLDSLSPLAVLSRGYSITFSLPEHRVVRDSASLVPGGEVELKFFKGGALCQVKDVEG